MKLTPEEKRLFKDPLWRLNNLYKIKTKQKKIVKFQMNNVQRILQASPHRLNTILKARQMGVSTYYLLKYLDMAAFTPNTTVAILSHKRESMGKLMAIVRRAHRLMHPKVQPKLDKGGGSAFSLRFPEIDSTIYCTLEAVSDAVNHLHISEMALNENPEKIDTSIDAVPLDSGHISVETTARGFNHFHDFWTDSENGYHKMFFPWYVHEEYQLQTNPLEWTEKEVELADKAKKLYKITLTDQQIAYRRAKIKQKKNNLQSFLQEYPEDDQSCFLSSGACPFDQIIISQLMAKCEAPINGQWEDTNNGWVGWKKYLEYDKSKKYSIGADPAEGVGSAYSTIKILEVSSRKEAFAFRSNKIKPSDFADKIIEFGNQYWTGGRVKPLAVVERNNHGHAVLVALQKEGYENIFYHDDDQPGWKQNQATRPLMLDTFKELLEDGFMPVYDKYTLNECLTMIDNNGKWEHEEGKNDDLVFAHALALQGCLRDSVEDFYDNIESFIRT